MLIPEHEHDDSGEQELYFIHCGAAMATLDGKQVSVPAGSAVAVEGHTRRKFEATASPIEPRCRSSRSWKRKRFGPVPSAS